MINKVIQNMYEKLKPLLTEGTLTKYKPTTKENLASDRLHVIYATPTNEVVEHLGGCYIYEHIISIVSISGKVEAAAQMLEDQKIIIDALDIGYPTNQDDVRIMEVKHIGNGSSKLEFGTMRHFNTLDFKVRYRF